MSRLDSLGLLLKDIYPCKLVLFFPSFADIKPPFNLQAGFDIRCIHLFNILWPTKFMNCTLVQAGGTDLLIEYEDMFPYWGQLANISARNAYSRQVKES